MNQMLTKRELLPALMGGAAVLVMAPAASVASFAVHFVLVPALLLVILWLAHWEGQRQASNLGPR
jgi:hypothetical protein